MFKQTVDRPVTCDGNYLYCDNCGSCNSDTQYCCEEDWGGVGSIYLLKNECEAKCMNKEGNVCTTDLSNCQ